MPPQEPAPQTRVHAFRDDALGDHDAVGLAAEIREGRVSRLEAVQASIARLQDLDDDLAGLAAERFATALTEARTPHDGFFAGQASFVKDNSDVAGLPTQQGTHAFVAEPAAADGDFARMFGLVGTTTLGKTRLSEYGFSASAEFADDVPVRNPWHTGHTSGASSAGSAAFVASGAVTMAHANDGGGSIRIPAACCGLVGLKPTRGRTPSDKGNREMPVRIVHDGVVTRSVRDTAAFLRESERVYRNLKLPPVGDVTGPGRKRLRVALVTNSIGGRVTDAETTQAVLHTAGLLEELGHCVDPVAAPVPHSFEDDFLLYWSSLALAISRAGRYMFNPTYDRSRNDNLTKGLARHAARNAWRLPVAIARLNGSHRTSKRFFADFDMVLTPTLSLVTPELGWLNPSQSFETVMGRLLEWVSFTPLQNANGDPAMSLPMGTTSGGLPIGVQLAAERGHDRRLLQVAYELEDAQPFARIQD
ncbi:MAG: amidase, Asp-tRNAAsn/Glu-tRNAGln amidotransferase subunit [Marmoricola sp.]|jgi:amidase|nr:amidase, Asp-tRNAAsn/Glu-tRNAGln amidotransferase subunit [Marmoricola sp.]